MNQCVTGHCNDTALVAHRVMMRNSGRIFVVVRVEDERQLAGDIVCVCVCVAVR